MSRAYIAAAAAALRLRHSSQEKLTTVLAVRLSGCPEWDLHSGTSSSASSQHDGPCLRRAVALLVRDRHPVSILLRKQLVREHVDLIQLKVLHDDEPRAFGGQPRPLRRDLRELACVEERVDRVNQVLRFVVNLLNIAIAHLRVYGT